ncbi:L,D-transpeptidase family protein [Alloyangia pacifica]|uniref:L,D-transpeptidase family protein n=1 Tax=Alloyangia pacifica TaxID=311180 RepID=UPI001CD34DB4|nr:L,D-transpeptidase family protein [Alloyangia pacifica]MCA0994020.1 L,D-transpeptidase family protein [Alloyangia pacifica]
MSVSDLLLTRAGLRFDGRLWPCVIGRGGVRAGKREGDGATPVGVHRIVAMLYRPDRMAQPAPWASPIGLRDLWCDDVASPAYNQLVEAPFAPSHETLRRADPLYDLVLITDWNWPEAEPGRGSAIFLHQWRRPGYPTAGCIGFDPSDLRRIAARLRPGARLVVPEALDGWRVG